MPPSDAEQTKQVVKGVVIVNAILQGSAYCCGGGRMHVLAAVASAVHYVVLIHASGNVLGNSRTEKFFDLTGALTQCAVVGAALYDPATGGVRALSLRQKLLAGMVVVWTLRLGSFLFLRIQKHGGVDPRFDLVRKYFCNFFRFWNISAVWVFYTSLAATTVLAHDHGPSELSAVDYLGIAVGTSRRGSGGGGGGVITGH
jgi:steroid 5-alpha reductase family enzyme